LRLPKVVRQGFLRPRFLGLRHTSVQELYQERSDSSSTEDEDKTGELGRLAIDEAEELSQVVQNPFIAATGSKRGVPRLVVDVHLVLEPVPHGVDVKPNFTRAEEPEGLAAIGHNDEFRCLPDRPLSG